MTISIPPDVRKADDEYADKLRGLIRHENEASNHRVTWLMVTEGLLFTAVSAVFKDSLLAAGGIGVLGILVAVSLGHSLRNSFNSRQHFKKLWRQRMEDRKYKEEDVLPLDGGYSGNRAIIWLLPDLFVPKLIVVAWVLVVGYTVVQGMREPPNPALKRAHNGGPPWHSLPSSQCAPLRSA